MQWTQYELAADSWQELQTADPTMLPASTRVAPVGPCQLQLDGQALVVQPERGTDLWPAMKQGKRPGQDPDARDRSTETWLAFRLAKLSSAEEKYTLLRAAVCEHLPMGICFTKLPNEESVNPAPAPALYSPTDFERYSTGPARI